MLATKGPEPRLTFPHDDSIVELSLMMPRSQFDALERRAAADGLSVAQFLRRLVRESTLEHADLDD
jgi:hypothetical protein